RHQPGHAGPVSAEITTRPAARDSPGRGPPAWCRRAPVPWLLAIGWTRQTLSGANGGSVDFATLKGKTATLTFTGFQVAWMSTQGPTRGSATVKLDSGTAATINTNASAVHWPGRRTRRRRSAGDRPCRAR